jgi:ribose-phosphate pyrophosphokinase
MEGVILKVFSGSSNPALAREIVDYLGIEMGQVELRRFPDGEIFARYLENVRGADVFIVQSICYPPNETLMELLIMIDAAKRASASRITAVLPFFGYARQDRKDKPRVPITAKLVANLLVASGVNRILTMDLHAQQIQGFFDIPVDHLYAAPVMVQYLKSKHLKNPVVVSPDSGAVKTAITYAEMLGAGLALGAKYRRDAQVEVMNVVGDVAGRTAIMVDDLTSTAKTLCEAAKKLKEHDAGDIYAVVSHPMIGEEGIERLQQSPISELIVTNSIPLKHMGKFPITVLSIAELLGEAIARINNNESVTSLFKELPHRENKNAGKR